MSISKKLRFEVFKRDGFTCQYCGKKTPETVLEVDHIVSANDGGQDDLTNLVTSCFDCNRGKGKISLDNVPTQEEDLHEKTIMLLEKERQIREYNQVLKQIRDREDEELEELNDVWTLKGHLNPNAFRYSSIRIYLKIFPKSKILEAIEIALEKYVDTSKYSRAEATFRYLCGILNNWRQQGGEGLVQSMEKD